MARENAILPKTLRETLGDAVGDESINFGEALAHADGMKPHFHAGLPHGHVGQEGVSKIADLPAAPMNVHAGTKIAYFGDLLMNQDYGEIQGPDGKAVGVLTGWKDARGQPCRLDVVKDLATKSNFSGLPPPFNLKSQPGGTYVMQIFVVGAGGGKVHIFKDVDLKGQFLKMASCEPMCHGTGVVYQYGNQYRAGRNAICYLLEKLGGLQVRFSTLTATAKPAKRSTEWDKKLEGYRYIEKKGPKSNNRNQFMEFADKEVNDPQSKIYGWEESRVIQALRNHASGRINAKRLTVWVLTLKDFEPWFINEVLAKILPTLRRNGVLWIGQTRVGKSTASKTLAFLMSMLEIDALEGDDGEGAPEPSIVTAKHFDFFKGEHVERVLPAVFDDGGLHKQDASVLKAFLNPSEEDSTLWARWWSSTFAPGASRQAVNNSYDNALEKRLVAAWRQGQAMEIPLKQFMNLIAPSLKQVTEEEDMKALLARTHVVVTTDARVYFRLASDEFPEDGVAPFFTYTKKTKPDLFNYSPEARACLSRYKDDPTSPNNYPTDFKEKSEWSLNFAKRLVRGEDVPTASIARGASLFGQPVHSVQPEVVPPPVGGSGSGAASSSGLSGPSAVAGMGCAGELSNVDAAEQQAIYAAMQDQFFEGNKRDSGALVDLMSPPRKRLATGARAPFGCGGELSDVDLAEQAAIYEQIQQAFFNQNQVLSGAQIDLTTPPRQRPDTAGDDFDLQAELERHLDLEEERERQLAEEARNQAAEDAAGQGGAMEE
ncbi:unnamed protein product [Prorocentrum cordatum]|uniref:Uncharacterized protein n=1 Tax=Prorocentrum cordatum TaxID=2364126 RepID=A0ABN9XVM5_9DINO|nr:unnamed protein product [Polarella glacialis]